MPKFDIGQVKPSEGAQNYRLEWVNINDIDSDPRNSIYSMEGIESLADSIKISGLLQPPLVRRTPAGGCQIISGHRRIEALKLLAKENPAYQRVQVQVDNDNDEISVGLKLIDANAETRILSNAELMAQAVELTRLLTERKKQEHLPGRVRDMVARRLEMSAGTVGELLAISNNLRPEIQELFFRGLINKQTAGKLAKQDEETQGNIVMALEDGWETAKGYIDCLLQSEKPKETAKLKIVSESDTPQDALEDVSESDTKEPVPAVTIEPYQPNEEEWLVRKERMEKHRQQEQEKRAEAKRNVSESDASDRAANCWQEQQPTDEEKELPPWDEENPAQKEKIRERDIAELEVLMGVLDEVWRELASGTSKKGNAFPVQAQFDATNRLSKIIAELRKEWIDLKKE